MNTRTACLLLAVCTAGAWWPAHAQNTDTSIVKLPQDITYKGLPGAPQHVTLFGDSSQPGLYVDRIKFLPGMKVMPDWHPTQFVPSWSCQAPSISPSASNGMSANSRLI